MRHSVLRDFLGLLIWLVQPVRLSFGGGGGSAPRPPAPPPAPPPPPPPAAAVTSARTALARTQPRRGRSSTILGGGPATNEPGKTVLGSAFTR